MKAIDRWDSLIVWTVSNYWPFLDPRFLKAVMIAESSGRAAVQSGAGAVGLLQLMPSAFAEAVPDELRGRPRTDPEANLAAGLSYLRFQFTKFPEVTDPLERLSFALASYNCGRGYVNVALKIWREANAIRPAGVSYQWERVKPHLANAVVSGRRPHFRDVWRYVDRIWGFWAELERAGRRFPWSPAASPINLPR